MKKISEFLSESLQFLEVRFSIYLNRRVFIMHNCAHISEDTFSDVTAHIITHT